MCLCCNSDTTKPGFTDHVVTHNGDIIIVKNVPCEECVKCGEKYFSDEVALLLESIVNKAKVGIQDKVVLDYNTVV